MTSQQNEGRRLVEMNSYFIFSPHTSFITFYLFILEDESLLFVLVVGPVLHCRHSSQPFFFDLVCG